MFSPTGNGGFPDLVLQDEFVASLRRLQVVKTYSFPSTQITAAGLAFTFSILAKKIPCQHRTRTSLPTSLHLMRERYLLLLCCCCRRAWSLNFSLQKSLFEQAKVTALATADAVAEGAKLAKEIATATYEAGKELVSSSTHALVV